MSIVIREARPDEFTAVSALCRAAYAEMASQMSPDDRDDQLRRVGDVEGRAGEGTILVAADGDVLVGSISYSPPFSPRPARFDPGWALVRMLAVAGAYRRRGVGRLLVEECLRRARTDRASTAALQTSELTPGAVALYEGLGFSRRTEFVQYATRYWVYAADLA